MTFYPFSISASLTDYDKFDIAHTHHYEQQQEKAAEEEKNEDHFHIQTEILPGLLKKLPAFMRDA